MSDAYIEQLEEENDRLRKALALVARQLEENWSDSLTIGLVPEMHFTVFETSMYVQTGIQPKRRAFKSLRLIREFILGIKSKNKDTTILIKTFDAGDDRRKIYKENIINDSGDVPITAYLLEYVVVEPPTNAI